MSKSLVNLSSPAYSLIQIMFSRVVYIVNCYNQCGELKCNRKSVLTCKKYNNVSNKCP